MWKQVNSNKCGILGAPRIGIAQPITFAFAFLLCLSATSCLDSSIPTPPATPSPLTLTSVTAATYNTTTTTLVLQGKLTSKDSTPQSVLTFFTDVACSADSAGHGLVSALETAGISIQVPSSNVTTIYFRTNTNPACIFVKEYNPDHSAPPPPQFLKTSPASPSRTTSSPVIIGTAVGSAATINLFDDSVCVHSVGSGLVSDFSTNGVQVTLQTNHSSTLYAKAFEPFGNGSACTLLGTYAHSTLGPTPPSYRTLTPSSPSNQSLTPVVTGVSSTDTNTLSFFSDASCSTNIGVGTKADFEGGGIAATATADSTTTIYSVAYDILGNPSTCVYLTSYTHDDISPPPPTFSSVTPLSPTRTTIYPRIKGTSSNDTVQVLLFNDAACLTQIGGGLKTQFQGPGLIASASLNSTTTIFAENFDAAGNASTCTHLVDFESDTIPPDPPVFGATNPISPNNKSFKPLVSGSSTGDTVTLNFFSNDTCTLQIGTGDKATFEGVGIQVTAVSNQTTMIYAQALDAVGNPSDCTLLVNYMHSTTPAPAPIFASTNPVSPSNFSKTPFVLGSVPKAVVKVQLFGDAGCTTQLGVGSRTNWITSGVSATVPPNALTTFYGMSTDVYGNTSNCVFLTNYIHDNQAPADPTFLATTPISPNNTSFSPLIQGTTPQNPGSILPPSRVLIFDSSSCLNQIGSGSPANFNGAGIVANVPINAATDLYSKVLDAAGNQSNCTSLTQYTHDTLKPGNPVFLSATPASPSYNRVTAIVGAIPGTTDFLPVSTVGIYSDPACAGLLASGPPGLFQTAGVQVTVPANTTTPLYALSTDLVGNVSACKYLEDYVHTDVAPSNFLANVAPDGAVSLSWNPDLIAFPTPTYVVKRSIVSGGPYTIIAPSNSGNTFSDLDASNHVPYYYVVAGTNNTGTSKDSAEISATVSLSSSSAPSSLTASPGPQQITLSWSGVTSAMTYDVYRAIHSGGPYTRIKSGLSATIYSDATTVDGNPYYYVVDGSNPWGKSAYSNEASAVSQPVPSAPSNLSLSLSVADLRCGGANAVILNWSAPSYYNQFHVQRSNSSGGEITFQTVGSNIAIDCNPNNTNVNSDGANYYAVTATWGNLDSARSNEVGIFSAGSPLLFSSAGNGEVLVNWLPVGYAVSYNLKRSLKQSGPYSIVATGLSSPSYLDSTVSNGQTYYYVFESVDSNGLVGWYSAETDATPGPIPPAPVNLVLSVVNGAPSLDWSPTVRYNGFNIYRAQATAGPYSLLTNQVTTHFVDSSANLGMNYYYVTTSWGTTETAASNTVSFRNAIPTAFTATSFATKIALAWGAVSGASNYNLWRSTTSMGPYTSVVVTGGSSYNDTSVVLGQGYFYVVRAQFPDATVGQNSLEVNGMAGPSTIPSGLTITGTTLTSVNLAWAKVPGATSYKVYKATAAGGPYPTVLLNPTVATVPVPTLAATTSYYFIVKSVVAGVTSAASAEVSAFTASATPAPSLIVGSSQIIINWSSTLGATSYSVQRSTDASTFATIAGGISGTSYTDSTVVNGNIYFYRVIAAFPGANLTSSVSIGATPGVIPDPPKGVTIVDNSTGTDLTLSWGAVPGANTYQMYLGTANGGPYIAAGSPVTGNLNNPINGLTPGTSYFMVVTASIGNGESTYSPQVAAYTLATPPAPTAVASASGTVSVSWTAVAGAGSYDLLRSTDDTYYAAIATGLATLTYTDSTVSAATPYYYKYLPKTASGLPMAYSVASAGVTPSVRLLPPTNLTGEASTLTSVALGWVQSSNATAYTIYRSTSNGGPYTLLQTVTMPGPTVAADNTVTMGNTYYYVVRAVNISGVESVNSNQAAVNLVSAPTGLAAVSGTNVINLNWTAAAGATSYSVRRSTVSGGPYGLLATGVLPTSFADTQIENGIRYYYVVAAAYATGSYSLDSIEASAIAVETMNLQVPIELTDQPLGSDTVPVLFERTRTSLDPTAYDGTITYYLEAVATNADSSPHSISIVDSAGVSVGSLSIPASTLSPTRLRVGVTPHPGADQYRLKLSATPGFGQLQIYSSRLLVKQINASKTKIYIPLLSSNASASSADLGAKVESTSNTVYASLPTASIYSRNTAVMADLLSYNAWELETLVSASGGAVGAVSLYDVSRAAIVDDTETLFSSASVVLATSPFNEGVPLFNTANEGDLYEVSIACVSNCGAGSVALYKAGLWVSLENLSKAELIYRNAFQVTGINSSTLIDSERTLFTTAAFSNPSVYFQAVGMATGAGTSTVELMQAGASDAGSGGLTLVPGSTLTYLMGSKTLMRTGGPLALTTGWRLITHSDTSGSSLDLTDTSLIIDAVK